MNRILDCPICGGNEYHLSEYSGHVSDTRGKTTFWTFGFCFDCGWYESDEPRRERSGFRSLEDLNYDRPAIGKDPLTYDEFVAIRTRIKAPIGEFRNPKKQELLVIIERSCLINRRPASRDP